MGDLLVLIFIGTAFFAVFKAANPTGDLETLTRADRLELSALIDEVAK